MNVTLIYVIAISETHLDKSILDNCISIPGFDIFRHDRSTGSHGGVCLFVRKHIKAVPVSNSMTSSLSKIEYLFFNIAMGGSKLLVGVVYNPPPVRDIGELGSFVLSNSV